MSTAFACQYLNVLNTITSHDLDCQLSYNALNSNWRDSKHLVIAPTVFPTVKSDDKWIVCNVLTLALKTSYLPFYQLS